MAGGAALFGNTSSRSQTKNLVECKAGKMSLKGKMVHPDKRKGLLYVYQSDDSLMHFCWKDRTTGTIEDDLIIFPDDCEFKRVNQCTTGRAYVLKFKSSSRKFFFWIQEPKTDKDEENCRRINEVLNNPPTPGSARSGGATPDGDLQNLLNNMSQQQLMQLFGGVGQIGGLSSLLGTMRPSATQSSRSVSSATSTAAVGSTGSATSSSSTSTTSTAVTATATDTKVAESKPGGTTTTAAAATAAAAAVVTTAAPAAPAAGTPASTAAAATTAPAAGQASAIQLSDLQHFLSGLAAPPPSSQHTSGVDLAQAINTDSLSAMLVEPGVAEALQQHLPAVAAVATGSGGSQNPSDQLRSTLSSPQFQQALSMFSAALQSGQLGPVVQQLEVGPEAVDAANQGNMEEFVRALEKASLSPQPDKQQEKEGDSSNGSDEKRLKRDEESKKPDEDDDEGMSMD